MSHDDVLKLAMQLPDDERQALIESLLETLPANSDDLHPAWAAEIRERIRAYEAGEVEAVPWEEARKRVFGR